MIILQTQYGCISIIPMYSYLTTVHGNSHWSYALWNSLIIIIISVVVNFLTHIRCMARTGSTCYFICVGIAIMSASILLEVQSQIFCCLSSVWRCLLLYSTTSIMRIFWLSKHNLKFPNHWFRLLLQLDYLNLLDYQVITSYLPRHLDKSGCTIP